VEVATIGTTVVDAASVEDAEVTGVGDGVSVAVTVADTVPVPIVTRMMDVPLMTSEMMGKTVEVRNVVVNVDGEGVGIGLDCSVASLVGSGAVEG
jgi:hypothetical protein